MINFIFVFLDAQLLSIKSQIDHLLDCNDEIPEDQRLGKLEFELNQDEKQRRITASLDKESNLKLELKAWQMARGKLGQQVRKQVWDDMEVQGRAIRVIRELKDDY